MPKGTIFLTNLVLEYEAGRSKARHVYEVNNLTLVGYDERDAWVRLLARESSFGKWIQNRGKTRNVEVLEMEIIDAMGLTMYCLETGKPLKQ